MIWPFMLLYACSKGPFISPKLISFLNFITGSFTFLFISNVLGNFYLLFLLFIDIFSTLLFTKHSSRNNISQTAWTQIRPDISQTAWTQIRPDILSGLIWVQTVCKDLHQKTKFSTRRQRAKNLFYFFSTYNFILPCMKKMVVA